MRWRRSPVLWFLLGALTMATVALFIALRLSGWPSGRGMSGADLRPVIHYPVAGGLPLGLRFDRPQRNWGDWEENLPELFRIASFEDLTILGAAGRSQIQALNEYDICCYNDSRYLAFAPAIQAVVEPLGGHFEIYWSEGEVLHRANPAALEVILADMRSRRMP